MIGGAIGLLAMTACQQGGGDSYTLKGDLKNLKDSVLFLAHQANGMPNFDTLHVKDGQFSFAGHTSEPMFAQVITADQSAGFPLILEPGKIDISGDADSMSSPGQIKVSGTLNNDALSNFMQIQRPYVPLMMKLQQDYMQANMSQDTAKQAEVEKTMDSIQGVITSDVKGFIRKNPKSVVSAMALQSMMTSLEGPELEQLFSGLDTAVQHSSFGEGIGSKIAAEKQTAIGQAAPDFTMNDTDGKPVSLSSFRGKYVLVDFWASWCGPCRQENPNVVKVYNDYKGKNFTILGVSLDKNKDAWLKAIEDDHLTWNHVSDLQYWDNSAAKLYGIQAIPANFLIDPEGKIIAKDLRGDDLKAELAQVIK